MSAPEDNRAQPDHFLKLVTKWSHFAPPLRPSPADTAVIDALARALNPGSRAAILGVTPETIACAWPADTRLFAIDHSVDMIRALWKDAEKPKRSSALAADWSAMPLTSGSFDLAVGDGCYVFLPHPDGFDSFTREVRRILRPGGRFAVRVFIRPDRPEPLEDIERAFVDGRIASVHALKLRLWAAVHEASGPGSLLADVWDAWRRLPPVPFVAGSRPGWTPEELEGIEGYRALKTRYFLPTKEQVQSVLSRHFERVDSVWTQDESGDRCPTFVVE